MQRPNLQASNSNPSSSNNSVSDGIIKVLLVDDHAMVRSGVQRMLELDNGIRVIGQAATAPEAMQLVHQTKFDVAIVDVSLPGKNGIELLKTLRAEAPKLPVLILSAYAEDVYAIRSIKNGAVGYLTKDSEAEKLISAVRTAADGGKYISPTLAESLADLLTGSTRSSHEILSDRELEVLKLIAQGESLNDIAKKLHVSPHTVTTYRARILKKTGLGGNAKLAIYARETGILN
jgi:DNA-binding NarL/FixJ family response regulator